MSRKYDVKGEDEAMFLEYRKSLKQVLDSIAQLDANFVLTTVKNIVLSTASEWRAKSFMDIENALHLLYLISEAIPVRCSSYCCSYCRIHLVSSNRIIIIIEYRAHKAITSSRARTRTSACAR